MCLEQLDYDLPAELIAQRPVDPRDRSRLLVLHRAADTIRHASFTDLPTLLTGSDCLVLNDTRVISARLVGRREMTGGRWEGLFLREQSPGRWELLCQTGGRPRAGEWFVLDSGAARLQLCESPVEGQWLMQPDPPGPAFEFLAQHGHVPLPPYIRDGVDEPPDRERYQTVYATRPGAIAAPTAGLHFTPTLLEALESRGVTIVRLTLHVGAGTFQPIRHSLAAHVMHAEWGELGSAAVAELLRCRERGGRVVAVGTTCVRALETAASRGVIEPWRGETSLFIRGPHRFRAVDALITNFHLPRTTLLALVHSFGGADRVRGAYAVAIRERYRFYSFGDAMLIL